MPNTILCCFSTQMSNQCVFLYFYKLFALLTKCQLLLLIVRALYGLLQYTYFLCCYLCVFQTFVYVHIFFYSSIRIWSVKTYLKFHYCRQFAWYVRVGVFMRRWICVVFMNLFWEIGVFYMDSFSVFFLALHTFHFFKKKYSRPKSVWSKKNRSNYK